MKKPEKHKNTRQKKKKPVFTDGIHSFMLVTLIVVFALCLSLTVISIRSTLDKKPQTAGIEQIVNTNTAVIPSDTKNTGETPEEISTPSENPQEPLLRPQNTRRQPGFENRINGRQPRTEQQLPERRSRTEQQQLPERRSLTEQQPLPERRLPTDQHQLPERNTAPSRPVVPDTSVPDKTTPAATTSVSAKPVENKGTLVFVIDDAGNNLRELDPFLNIPGPLTIAILPGLPYSAEAARRIRAAGKEAILHQPMEAIGGQNPGPGAIFSGMSADEIKTVLTRNIAEVGPVAGINNHQGSKITMDSEMMKTILAFCKENNLYFLDSRTTADSVVPSVARQTGTKTAERNVFIDNEQNKNAMLRYITGGLTKAQTSGLSVMIGHTWSPDLAPLLKEQYPLLTQQGYTIKTASDIVK